MIRATDVQIEDLSKQEKVIRYYFGMDIDLNKKYLSPFREDKTPSCSFYYSKNGVLKFNDWAAGEQYNATELVMKKFGLTYGKALQKINLDLEKINQVGDEVVPREDVELTCIVTSPPYWTEYWSKYGINERLLQEFNVSHIGKVYRNNKLYLRATRENPIYAYQFSSGRIKLYRPLSPDGLKKWYGNSNSEDVGGMVQLPKKGVLCFITSSVKDVMVLKTFGFPAVCMNGEGYGTSKHGGKGSEVMNKLVKELKKRYRFVLTYLDGDQDGLKFAHKLYEIYGLRYINNPVGGPKDVSDYVAKFGRRKTWNLLRKLIKNRFK